MILDERSSGSFPIFNSRFSIFMRRFILLLGVLLAGLWVQAGEARLLRFPHSVGNKLVFSYAGDLYLVSAGGGTARRLTSHVGYEMFPRISPDGKYIAFTGQYDGNTEVFVIPVEGGEPRRLTYTATLKRDDLGDRMGPNNVVIGWTPDSKRILYRSRRYTFNDFTGQLFTVPVEGGMSEEIPLKNGGFASYSPDGKKLAYNYIFREFRAWKRYQGGMADDIRVFDFNTKKSERITGNVRQDVFPMWSPDGNTIYYISDRGDIMNLYAYNVNTKEDKQLTSYKEYDIKFPAIGDKLIVYEQGGYIYGYDLQSGKESKITINIDNDQVYSRPTLTDVSGQISSIAVAPGGERVVVAARGDIFSLPVKEGITYNLTNSSGANDMQAGWSPDGKYISYVSDKDGEFNIYLRDVVTGKERKLIKNLKSYIFNYKWSPDSKKILWSEKGNTLNISDVESGNRKIVEKSGIRSMTSYNWSPDSKYITYVRPETTMDNIIVCHVESGEKHQVTDGWFGSSSPNFSEDGKYLVFVSARTFSPTYGRTEWNHVYNDMNKVYILPLAKDAPVLFAPKNDVVRVETAVKEKNKKEESEDKGVVYDFTNLESRLVELPVLASNYYGNVHMLGNRVYYNRGGRTLIYDLNGKKETDMGGDIEFSPGYKKAIVSSGSAFQVEDLPVLSANVTSPVPTKGVKRVIDYHQEWMQIYNESWRQMRDFFYAKNMHGVDWDHVYEKYKVLVPYVNHRTDLTYIIGEMIAELSVGHAYSINGRVPMPERIDMGLLGAKFVKDKSGYFKVTELIEGANWDASTRSPLTMPGVEVKTGDYILAINGKSLREVDNLFSELIDMAGKTVELTVNTTPAEKGARNVLVVPLADESKLYYYNWVQNNIRKVNEATNGEIGYIHIPDMGVDGLNEFVKHYYPQLNKKALIIDDRGNGGGNVSPMITERLMRTPTFYTMHTNQTVGSVSPVGTFLGPKVLLVNEYSASDGDLFPYRFKYNHLGTIIGRRTWGGVVGYSGSIRVVDGGSIVTPSYAPFAADGSEFIIEGTGVAPHVDIENDPYLEYNGEDQQLNKAIQVILEKLKTEKKEIPSIPVFPNKAAKKK